MVRTDAVKVVFFCLVFLSVDAQKSCTGPQDQASLAPYLPYANFTALMTKIGVQCAFQCLSTTASASCNTCTAQQLSFSSNCKTCFGGLVFCTAQNCISDCFCRLSNSCTGNGCDGCVDTHCNAAFATCSGLAPPKVASPTTAPSTLHPTTLKPTTSKPTTSKPTTSRPSLAPTRHPTFSPSHSPSFSPSTTGPTISPTASTIRTAPPVLTSSPTASIMYSPSLAPSSSLSQAPVTASQTTQSPTAVQVIQPPVQQTTPSPTQATRSPVSVSVQATQSPSQITQSPSQITQSPSQITQSPTQTAQSPSPSPIITQSPSQVAQSPSQSPSQPSRTLPSPSESPSSQASQGTEAPSQVTTTPSQITQTPSSAPSPMESFAPTPAQGTNAPSSTASEPQETSAPSSVASSTAAPTAASPVTSAPSSPSQNPPASNFTSWSCPRPSNVTKPGDPARFSLLTAIVGDACLTSCDRGSCQSCGVQLSTDSAVCNICLYSLMDCVYKNCHASCITCGASHTQNNSSTNSTITLCSKQSACLTCINKNCGTDCGAQSMAMMQQQVLTLSLDSISSVAPFLPCVPPLLTGLRSFNLRNLDFTIRAMGIPLRVFAVSVQGIPTMQKLDVTVIQNETSTIDNRDGIALQVGFEWLNVTMAIEVYGQNVTLAMSMPNFTLFARPNLLISRDLLQLPLRELYSPDFGFSCLLQRLYGVSFGPGGLGIWVDWSRGGVTAESLTDVIEPVIIQLLNGTENIDQFLLSDVNNLLRPIPTSAAVSCRSGLAREATKPAATQSSYFDWSGTVLGFPQFFPNLNRFIEQNLDQINNALGCFLSKLSLKIANLTHINLPQFQFDLNSIGLGPASLAALQILDPMPPERYSVANRVGLGPCSGLNNASCKPAAIEVNLSLSDPSTVGNNEFALAVWMENFIADLRTIVKLNSSMVGNIHVGNPELIWCALAAVESLQIENMSFSVQQLWLSMLHLPVTSTSSLTLEIQDKLVQDRGKNATTHLIRELLAALELPLTRLGNRYAGDYIGNNANLRCTQQYHPASKSVVPVGNGEKLKIVWAVLGSLAVLIVICILFALCFRNQARVIPQVTTVATTEEGEVIRGKESSLEGSRKALIVHPKLGPFTRYGVIVAILAAVALFISSHLSIGANADIVLWLFAVGPFEINLFQFSLKHSVEQMWAAKVYALTALILFLSGIWPYVKLITMAVIWVVPPPKKGTGRARANLLDLLDILGKWSLIDMFVLALFMAAFRMHIVDPFLDLGLSPGNHWVRVEVVVIAGYGISGFVVAALISVVATQVMRVANRKANDMYPIRSGGERQSLILHTFSRSINPEFVPVSQPRKLGWVGRLVILLCLAGCIALLVSCWILQAFAFRFKGLASLVLGTQSRGYSLIELGTAMTSDLANNSDTGFVQVVYLVMVVVVPGLWALGMWVLYWMPLSATHQAFLMDCLDAFQAWTCLDVLFVSLVAAVVELPQFAQFMVGSACSSIDVILRENFDANSIPGGAMCVGVETVLLAGCWCLLGAAIILPLTHYILLTTARFALAERVGEQASLYTDSLLTPPHLSSLSLCILRALTRPVKYPAVTTTMVSPQGHTLVPTLDPPLPQVPSEESQSIDHNSRPTLPTDEPPFTIVHGKLPPKKAPKTRVRSGSPHSGNRQTEMVVVHTNRSTSKKHQPSP